MTLKPLVLPADIVGVAHQSIYTVRVRRTVVSTAIPRQEVHS